MIKNGINLRILDIFSIISNFLYFVRLKDYLKKTAVKPDLNQKYIYYPLHFDLRVVTMPLEDIRANQILNIKKLAAAIPKDWQVYIKMHPSQINIKLNFWSWEIYGNVMRYFKSKESTDYILRM